MKKNKKKKIRKEEKEKKEIIENLFVDCEKKSPTFSLCIQNFLQEQKKQKEKKKYGL